MFIGLAGWLALVKIIRGARDLAQYLGVYRARVDMVRTGIKAQTLAIYPEVYKLGWRAGLAV